MKCDVKIELLLNPFCMADRDRESVSKVCEEFKVPLTTYNPWEIEDSDLSKLPSHIKMFLEEVRSGQRPGSVYSHLFIAGKRIHLNAWPEHLDKIKKQIEIHVKC